MPTPPLPDSILLETLSVVREHGNRADAAKALGLDWHTVNRRLKRAEERGFHVATGQRTGKVAVKFQAPELPDDLPPIEELIAHRVKTFQRKQTAHDARKLIPITVNETGPIGILVFGDLHLDDDGCNWPLVLEHTRIAKETEGMFAGSIGDLQNGWIGRLARKWADQSTSGREAWALVEWWVQEIGDKLIFICEGNHDAWAKTVNGISPVQWIMAYQPGVSDSDGIRLSLHLPAGQPVTINARHDFRGRSQYNAAHGATKAALFGWRDDVLIAGHTHQSGYNVLKDPRSGQVSHAVRVASYKAIDSYAKQEGFPDENIFEAACILIDPDHPDPRHRVWIEFSPIRAAEILTMKREKWKARRR